jgi:hypothetical protein
MKRWPIIKQLPPCLPSSKTGLTDIEDIVPWVRFLVSEGGG